MPLAIHGKASVVQAMRALREKDSRYCSSTCNRSREISLSEYNTKVIQRSPSNLQALRLVKMVVQRSKVKK